MKTVTEFLQYQPDDIAGLLGKLATIFAYATAVSCTAFLLTRGIAITGLYLCQQLFLA